jgi:hypothetical protein
MNVRVLVRLALAALFIVALALPARAGSTSVTSLDGVITSYSATVSDLGGGERSLAITFNDLNIVSRINGSSITPKLSADFPTYLTTVVTLTPIVGGDALSLASPPGKFGVQNLSQVVFDYTPTTGTTSAGGAVQGLTLSGSVRLDSLSPATSLAAGAVTYDFSPFAGPNGAFTFTFNSANDIVGDLLSGSGTFTGSASFSLVSVPEPATVVLFGLAGVVAVARRRRTTGTAVSSNRLSRLV